MSLYYLAFIFALCVIFRYIMLVKIVKNRKPIIIAIEGNIGVGKTTFLEKMKSCKKINDKSNFISEPVDIWLSITDNDGKNILGKYYDNKERWSYTFQNFSYITKMTKLVDAIRNSNKQIIFLDRSIGTDKNVFAKMLYDDGMLGNLEYKMYNLWSDFYDKYISNNDKKNIIYLRCDPLVAQKRIIKRGRNEEKNIPIEYLTSLHEYHEKWIEREIQSNNTNVLVFDWNNDLTDDEIVEHINKNIYQFINSCK